MSSGNQGLRQCLAVLPRRSLVCESRQYSEGPIPRTEFPDKTLNRIERLQVQPGRSGGGRTESVRLGRETASKPHAVQLLAQARRRRRPPAVRQKRFTSLRSSLIHSTALAIVTQPSHWLASSGTVPKAALRKARWTTATCNATDRAMALHSHGLAKTRWNALAVSERALKQLKSWAKTRTVKPMSRAASCAPGSLRAPGAWRETDKSVKSSRP